jgi:hypothetical protein
MSNMLKWAEQELKLAGYDVNDPEDGPNLQDTMLMIQKMDLMDAAYNGKASILTAHMIRIGREAGVPVYKVKNETF